MGYTADQIVVEGIPVEHLEDMEFVERAGGMAVSRWADMSGQRTVSRCCFICPSIHPSQSGQRAGSFFPESS